eukprot:TRINITY_DN40366_c0_g1_i1.p1 TRINITY_DN40366_c0_g1~~TRINITY_DN40366_c0_g1_i1.p1  ORF type:complete len:180 (-),score=62.57 TRINITY_DN40366_c0_g1_i1:74-613(-)
MATDDHAGEEWEEESIFYMSQKALLLLRLKLGNNEDIERSLLDALAFAGDYPDEELLIPVDLREVEREAGAPLVDEDARLDVEGLVTARGSTSAAAEALLQAQKLFLANAPTDAASAEQRAQPLTAREWRELWYAEGEAVCEYGEEEELLEEPEEEEAEVEGEEYADAVEPAAKRARPS